MNEISIRPAARDDLQTLLEFEHAIIETERPFDPTIRTGPDVHYYDLQTLIASPDAKVLIAEMDSEIVASGHAQIRASESYVKHSQHAYLGFMYVAPKHRGSGIIKRILAELEAWARSRGVTELRLEVYAGNESALRAYEKSGYEKLTLLMRKHLDT